MRLSGKQYLDWPQKSVTLLGMSGVGKTVLASKLRRAHWYHYSGDYRIGSRYLDEAILDDIKKSAMTVPLLRDLLRSDSITISNKITFDNLKPMATFLGKVGDPAQGGLSLEEFKRRQRLHRAGEIAAMNDVPSFIKRSRQVYGYDHFINDAGGSVCELDEPSVLETLSTVSVIVYIKATAEDEQALVQRQLDEPKPMYYRENFLDEHLPVYLEKKQLSSAEEIEPDDFVRWIFPKLFYERIPRYEAIAKQYGYVIGTGELAKVSDADSFNELIASALDNGVD